MPRAKHRGKAETFSVSVSRSTEARPRKAAGGTYGGHGSASIEAIELEAERQDALDWLLRRAAPIEGTAFEAFMKEMAGSKR